MFPKEMRGSSHRSATSCDPGLPNEGGYTPSGTSRDLEPEFQACLGSISRPEFQARLGSISRPEFQARLGSISKLEFQACLGPISKLEFQACLGSISKLEFQARAHANVFPRVSQRRSTGDLCFQRRRKGKEERDTTPSTPQRSSARCTGAEGCAKGGTLFGQVHWSGGVCEGGNGLDSAKALAATHGRETWTLEGLTLR